MAVAVDPHAASEAEVAGGDEVVLPALGDVDDLGGVDVHGLEGVLEALPGRLVGLGLLGGDDMVELDAHVGQVLGDEVVVRVGDDGDLVPGLQRPQGGRDLGVGAEGGHGRDQGLAVGLPVLQAVQTHRYLQAGGQQLAEGTVCLQDGVEPHDAEVVEELVDVQTVQVQPVGQDLQGGGAELEVDQGAVGIEGDDLTHGVQPLSGHIRHPVHRESRSRRVRPGPPHRGFRRLLRRSRRPV